MGAKRTAISVGALVAALTIAGCAAESTPPAAHTTPTAAPSPVPTLSAQERTHAWVDRRLAGMTLEQKAASLLMVHAPGTDPAPLRALVDQGVGGVILMGDNIPGTPEELRDLTSALHVESDAATLVGIDEEGGIVQRLPWDPAADPAQLRAAPAADAQTAFSMRADVLAASGINVNFGIVADVTADPASFIWDRVLGTDPQSAGDRVAAAVTGEQAQGSVAGTVKHFPGHGAAPGDSHTSVPAAPLTLDEWRSAAAPPFRAAVDADVDLVMTGHLAYPAVDPTPASLSPVWHRILREELGFDGVVVTDDMLMLQHNGLAEYADAGENAIRAVAAGSDLLLYVLPADPSTFGISVPGLSAALADAVRSGRIPQDRLDEAAARVMTLRADLSPFLSRQIETREGSDTCLVDGIPVSVCSV